MKNSILSKSIKRIFEENIQFQQQWQWSIKFSGPNVVPLDDFDIYAKGINYGGGTIEYESKTIGGNTITYPTHQTAGTVSMTIRDDVKGTVENWMKGQLAKVIHPNGTVSLPMNYVFTMQLYRLIDMGNGKFDELLANTWEVSAASMSDFNREKDNLTEFCTFTLEFQKAKSPTKSKGSGEADNMIEGGSVKDTLAGLAKKAIGGLF